jgi:allophanate hydrolase subunit 1
VLANNCDSQGTCPPSEQGDLDAFHSMRTVSTVSYVVGAIGLVAGGVLWLTAPPAHPARASAQVWLGPGSAGIGGRF